MTSANRIIAIFLLLCFMFPISLSAQENDPSPNDSLLDDSIYIDSAGIPSDSTTVLPDSLGWGDTTQIEQEPPPPPPVSLMDSLTHYFARRYYEFEIQQSDLYPRNAAGFLYHEASYYSVTSLETPLRTTVSAFGLPGSRMTVRNGKSEAAPYDRTIPADGLIDFDDIATGDIARAAIVEGPLAGYNSLRGGSSLLHMEPFEIPEGPARSQFIVERGSFGYAYTRGRVARMFSPDFGLAFSTDYRKGDGFTSNVDDDSYNVKARIFNRFDRLTTLDAGISVYRRKGGYLFYRRLRRDQQWTVSVNRQEFYGGSLTGKYNLDLSRSADFSKTIRPRNTYTEWSYLLPRQGALYQATLRFGKEQYYINQCYAARYYGFGGLSGFFDLFGGHLFFFGRVRNAEDQKIGFDGAAGFTRLLTRHLKVIVSGGYYGRWPDLTDLFLTQRLWGSDLSERGNPDLQAEKILSGNATLAFVADKVELSASLNAGTADDLIYHDRKLDNLPVINIVPENDNLTFVDLNLSCNFRDLWWFFGKASATGRRIDSDRFGDSTPYSPRWQVYGMLGMNYHVEKLKIHVRLFGDITYTEKPLGYLAQELETAALFSWGVNASLKDFTFYYMIHNALDQFHLQPEDYGYTGWFNSWGISWKFLD
jgi:hypothetical protein